MEETFIVIEWRHTHTHSEKASLRCNSTIVCDLPPQHPCKPPNSHPESILDQFHASQINHSSKMENIFGLIVRTPPPVIKLLGGLTKKIIHCCCCHCRLYTPTFLPSYYLNCDAGGIFFFFFFLTRWEKYTHIRIYILIIVNICTCTNSGALKGFQETIDWRGGWSDQLCAVPWRGLSFAGAFLQLIELIRPLPHPADWM